MWPGQTDQWSGSQGGVKEGELLPGVGRAKLPRPRRQCQAKSQQERERNKGPGPKRERMEQQICGAAVLVLGSWGAGELRALNKTQEPSRGEETELLMPLIGRAAPI